VTSKLDTNENTGTVFRLVAVPAVTSSFAAVTSSFFKLDTNE
jgi:hypothetical protein